MQKCKLIILLSGMPAGGKSTIAKKFLYSTISSDIKIGYVPGDTVAHLVFNCQYTETEMNLKYINMKNIINQLSSYCDVIFIEDFFKRDADLNEILKCCKNIAPLHTYSLICSYETAIQRNFYREKEQSLPLKILESYYQKFLPFNIQGDIKLNSETLSVEEISNILLTDVITSIK